MCMLACFFIYLYFRLFLLNILGTFLLYLGLGGAFVATFLMFSIRLERKVSSASLFLVLSINYLNVGSTCSILLLLV